MDETDSDVDAVVTMLVQTQLASAPQQQESPKSTQPEENGELELNGNGDPAEKNSRNSDDTCSVSSSERTESSIEKPQEPKQKQQKPPQQMSSRERFTLSLISSESNDHLFIQLSSRKELAKKIKKRKSSTRTERKGKG